jgi:hypothetical protein
MELVDTESWRSGSSDRGSPNQVPDHQAKSMNLDTRTGLWSQELVSQRLGTYWTWTSETGSWISGEQGFQAKYQ